MKIGILIRAHPAYQIGGAEKQAFELAEQLSQRHDVMIITRRWDFKIDDLMEVSHFQIKSIPFIKFPVLNGLSYILNGFREIKKQKDRIDVLFVFGVGPEAVISTLTRKYLKIPAVLFIRGLGRFVYGNFIYRKMIVPVLLNNVDLIVTQTNNVKRNLIQCYKNIKAPKITIIPNAICLSDVRAKGEKIICVSNLRKVKGHKYLIEAVRDMTNPPQCIFIGDGKEREKLERRARGLNIKFMGRVHPEKVREFLVQGKIFVLPSLSEGFPNALLEAMAVGLPVIASNVGGIPDVIEHGKTGFLVEPKRHGEIKRFIELLLQDEELRKSISDNCLEESKKYSWREIKKVYDNLLGTIKQSPS